MLGGGKIRLCVDDVPTHEGRNEAVDDRSLIYVGSTDEVPLNLPAQDQIQVVFGVLLHAVVDEVHVGVSLRGRYGE